MNEEMRFAAMIDADSAVLRQWAEEVAATAHVMILEAPHEALIHVKGRDLAQGSGFYLGEALFTRCRVRVNGVIGFGACLGADPQRALSMAILDAALAAELPMAKPLAVALNEQQDQAAARQRLQEALVRRTKVAFEF